MNDGPDRPIRLFLDAGVIVQGCLAAWGAAKALLILATIRARFTVVLVEAVEREVERAIADEVGRRDPAAVARLTRDYAGWLGRVRVERHPSPAHARVQEHAVRLLPALRHLNDLPAVVGAMLARPDWVISTNRVHWTPELAARTGLRIATPQEFLAEIRMR